MLSGLFADEDVVFSPRFVRPSLIIVVPLVDVVAYSLRLVVRLHFLLG